jgi:hypothetical protein
MCNPANTQTTEVKTPEPLPPMVPLCTLPHAQRQLFCLGHNGRPELDLMARNPEKKKVVTPSPGQESTLDSTKQKRAVPEQERAEVVAELDSCPIDDEEPGVIPNVSIFNADRTNLESIHVLLLFDGCKGLPVVDFLFACSECGESGSPTIKKVSAGIATSLNFFANRSVARQADR